MELSSAAIGLNRAIDDTQYTGGLARESDFKQLTRRPRYSSSAMSLAPRTSMYFAEAVDLQHYSAQLGIAFSVDGLRRDAVLLLDQPGRNIQPLPGVNRPVVGIGQRRTMLRL